MPILRRMSNWSPDVVYMVVRKVLTFNTVYGFTIPKEYAKALDLEPGDYVQVFLAENKSLIIIKRENDFVKITRKDGKLSVSVKDVYVQKTITK